MSRLSRKASSAAWQARLDTGLAKRLDTGLARSAQRGLHFPELTLYLGSATTMRNNGERSNLRERYISSVGFLT